MAKSEETSKMKLVSLKLEQAGKGTLRDYLTKAREKQDSTLPLRTWDEIAHDIWNETGEPVVRESVRMWAAKYGLLKTETEGAGV